MGDLTSVVAEAGAAEGDPRPVYTWEGPLNFIQSIVRSYTPSDGGAPRLVANIAGQPLGVWDTGTGTFVGALESPQPDYSVQCVTYQRQSDGRPRVAAATNPNRLCIWDGDDLQLLHSFKIYPR
jgi:hypothetical protein